MQTELEFAEVRKFRFDSRIQASDGEAGRLVALLADPESRTITAIGIQIGFLGLGKTHFLPLALVEDASAAAVTVSVTLAEIEQKDTAPTQGVQLTRSTRIAAGGKSLGRLAQLTINAQTRALRHLVLDRGLGREVLVPASAVTSIGSKQIEVDLGATSVGQLTLFRPDAELYDAVHAAIDDYEPLRIDLPGIEIYAIDGSVWLKGHVSTALNRRLVEDQLQGIAGIEHVYNELEADNELAAAVSYALAHDPRTAKERIGVYPQLGIVRLRGAVRTPDARQAASAIASAVPGVKAVENELHVDPHSSVVPVLASVTGGEEIVPGSE
jgi:osmotically-inducible protein OsmY